MDLGGTASLIIAAFELSSVRLIRDAMRTADLASGRGTSATPLGPDPTPDIAPRRHIVPEPVYEPRRHITPEPKYEERTVYYTVRYEPAVVPPCPCGPCPENDAPRREWPIPPVWATLPPVEHPAPPRRVVKFARHHPDNRKGLVVDVHV